jgi:hypothetical protein
MDAKIEGWRDMEKYGFIPLSGESCGIGMRRIVDLKPEAVQLINEFLSTEIKTGNNWNSSDGQVASILMSGALYRNLAVYALLRDGHKYVVDVNYADGSIRSDYIAGFRDEASFREWANRASRFYLDTGRGGYRVYHASGDRVGGMRNLHFWTGRIE